MGSPAIAIVDYAAGNLASVAYAVKHLGHEPTVTRQPEEIAAADRVIFPGVGAAGACMDNLKRLGLDEALAEVLRSGRPLLGICVGCQVIFDHSEEDDGTDCLGFLPGSVKLFRFAEGVKRKVPHMGWNAVTMERDHPLVRDLGEKPHFYFVHSYYPAPKAADVILGSALYGGVRFPAALASENLAAVQFHTEKSGRPGLKLLDNFLNWTP
jgi:glutamine amidotransferase